MRPFRSKFSIGVGCFFLPALLFLAVCAAMGFAPFGDSSILIFDLSDQFVEFLCALKHGDVFFSWNTALGGSYIGTFSYYVSSPFSLLTLLCPDEHMPIAVVFLVALKLGLAGLTFSLLLHRRTARYNLTTVAFSLCYALMAYNMAYAMSFMWLDGVLWLPVLLMGVQDLLEGKRPWVLLAGLVVSFVSSWYISYMTGIFCALYLLWRCFCEGKPLFRSLARLAGWAVLALMLTAWLWLPTAMSMLAGKLAEQASPVVFGFNWPVTTLFYKLLIPGAYDSVTYTGSAFLYCSLLAVILAGLWFFLPHISKRAKLSTLLFGGFLLVCLWFAPLDRVWHVFQAPNSFPGRWSFVVSCFILLLAYDALLWLLDCIKTVRLSKILPALLVLVLAVDMTSNALLVFRSLDAELGFESYASYYDYKSTMQPLVDEIHVDNQFLRVASDLQRSRNEPAAFGYKGLTFFSSSYDANVNHIFGGLGLAQKWFWSTSLGSTPVTDVLLGVGWHISHRPQPDCYDHVMQNNYAALYRTPFTPSPAYFTSVDLSVPSAIPGSDCFRFQNGMLSALSGCYDPIFVELSPKCTQTDGTTRWTVTSQGGPLYALFPYAENHTAWLYVNNASHGPLYTTETDCIQYLGTFSPGEQVDLDLHTDAPSPQALICELDTAAYARALESIAPNRLQVTQFSNGLLEGTFTAITDGWLYTSIPAQPGWTVCIDGKPTEHIALLDTLIAVPVTTGEHTVIFSYTPPGLYPGLALTVLGALVTIALLFKKRKQK